MTIILEKLCFSNTPLWILDSSGVHYLLRFDPTRKLDQILNYSSFLQYLAMTLQTDVSSFSPTLLTWNHGELNLPFSQSHTN